MISRATDLVEAGRYRSPFGYILVDEFQDISPSRAKLLKALLDRSPGAQLFAVGDDWQAIYRFGGSDIAVMREFGEHFGAFERIDLETTFRCSDRSRGRHRFRAAQPRANPQDGPRNAQGGPTGRAYWSSGRAGSIAAEGSARPDRRECPPTRWDIRGAAARPLPASETPKDRRSGKAVSGSPLLLDDRAARRGSKATTRWCSACVAANTGFPAEIVDDPLLELLLSAPEAHPNAEERRLLYVAITRVRRQVFLLADGGPPSTFVSEPIDGGFDVAVFGRSPEDDVRCPRCTRGRLERRENARNGSIFYGCSNFPLCEHTARACPNCGKGLPVRSDGAYRCRDCGIEACPVCGGWLVTRMGKYSCFLGCSNWPDCDYKRNPRQPRNGHGTASDNAKFGQRKTAPTA